jgi:ubiquitin C-terminal hydrolase
MCEHKFKELERIGHDVAYQCEKCGQQELRHEPIKVKHKKSLISRLFEKE